jgi:hypothetical protein
VTSNGLPPWGRLDDALLSEISARRIPRDWRSLTGGVRNLANWRRWRNGVIADIAGLLWPIYQPGGSAWSGQRIAHLFDADFRLFPRLHLMLDKPVIAGSAATHSDFFTEEDSGTILFGSGYQRYDPTLSRKVRYRIPDSFNAGIINKVASLDLQMKLFFQRPRAYQVALIQGRPRFHHRWGRTANTPSLVSGHCLEASLGGCQAFADLSRHMSPNSLEILKQFTVDRGDRRVFAGVHYPSDNLSSWFTALRLIPHVFGPRRAPAVKQFLWGAISSKSVVFRAVERHVRVNGRSSPYRRIVIALRKLGST